MACSAHAETDSTCAGCFNGELLAYLSALKNGNVSAKDMRTRHVKLSTSYSKIKDKSNEEVTLRLVQDINYAIAGSLSKRKNVVDASVFEGASGFDKDLLKLVKKKEAGEDAAWIAVPGYNEPIEHTHRTAYRRFLRKDGSWIGTPELEALARLFHVNLQVHIVGLGFIDINAAPTPATRVLFAGNAATPLAVTCLRHSGLHYECARLAPPHTPILLTNKNGNCGLEAFLTAVTNEPHLRANQPWNVLWNAYKNEPTAELSREDNLYRGATIAQICDGWLRLKPANQVAVTDDSSANYIRFMENFRGWLAAAMTNAEIDKAIRSLGGGLLPLRDSARGVLSLPSDPKETAIDATVDIAELSLKTAGEADTTVVQGGDYDTRIRWMGCNGNGVTQEHLDGIVEALHLGTAKGFIGVLSSKKQIDNLNNPGSKSAKKPEEEYSHILLSAGDHVAYTAIRDELVGANATHFGVGLAVITASVPGQKEPKVFAYICAAANMLQSGAIALDAQGKNNKGTGIHTEMYCLIQLESILRRVFRVRFSERFSGYSNCLEPVTAKNDGKDVSVKSVNMYYFTELPICVPQCQPGLLAFEEKLRKVGIDFSVVEVDANMKKRS
ncbi:hypothetical protein BO221_36380 [Archangium sp. Cb G35]|uniref:hypothetical protein n=1 Tax=Archangium sp. Cb G35 TaxID=1920190 RepID=UPI000936EB18|nr:hypothetical protein [Archangium sp. Cb G35]OJT19000.1 hypothetical protein BO221_36380 [Archangium sp. Cb G35]